MIRFACRSLYLCVLSVACAEILVPAGSARACVRLEWRTTTPVVEVDDPVNIGLYAVGRPDNAQDDANQPFIAANITFGWDNSRLQLLGLLDSGNASIEQSAFLCPDGTCFRNEQCPPGSSGPWPPPSDGDGFYLLTTRLSRALIATPEGVLLTTFQFRARALGTATVDVLVGSSPCWTIVYGGEVPNQNVFCFPDGYGHINVEIQDIPCESVWYADQPTSDVVCEGAMVALSATAMGTPPLAYQWRKEGVTIDGATSETLLLSNTQDIDTANYDVVVTNECGSLVSDAATVLVWPIGTSDANGDGVVDGLDIAPFVHVALTSPNGPPDLAFCAADINSDGVVNLADVEMLVTALLTP